MKIFELNAPFVTPRDIELPPVDKYGMFHGQYYRPMDEARIVRGSTRTVFSGLKFDRRFEGLSTNETRIITALQFHPYIIDIREQYATCDERTLHLALRHGERMKRLQMTTVDVIVTFVLHNSKVLHYHTIPIKPADHVPDKADLERERKEENFMAQLGSTWELILGDAISQRQHVNNLVLLSYVLETDIHAWYDAAGKFSRILLRSDSTKGMAGDVLDRVSRRAGVSLSDAFRLFAVGVAFGFLRLDHSMPFSKDHSLFLDDGTAQSRRTPVASTPTSLLMAGGWL